MFPAAVASDARLPVMVLPGFLGVGKASLLNQLLHHRDGLQVAVIVNDMSGINTHSTGRGRRRRTCRDVPALASVVGW